MQAAASVSDHASDPTGGGPMTMTPDDHHPRWCTRKIHEDRSPMHASHPVEVPGGAIWITCIGEERAVRIVYDLDHLDSDGLEFTIEEMRTLVAAVTDLLGRLSPHCVTPKSA